MSQEMWLTLVSIAVGTYLIRLLPYLWMRKKLAKHANDETTPDMPDWLTVSGPAMIAAMLGSSLVPVHLTIPSWTATVAGLLATLLVWTRTRSMGLPTLTGVVVFGAVKVVLG